jgi:hypothetical protein
LDSVDPDFPLHLWDRLLPQAELTLNILRTSRQHPQLSAAAHYHGMVDYNKTAFSPPGCKIIAHQKQAKRGTWAPHGQHGYSSGPAIHHYRCQNVYILATASERIVDMLEFFPHNSPIPQLSSTERFIMAAKYMTKALKHPHPEVPFAHVGDDTITALTQLAGIFKNKFQKPKLSELTHSPTKSAENKRPFALTQPILTSTITVGGDILDYSGDVATSTADITTFKILINSTLSTDNAAMIMMDIKKIILALLPRYKYIRMWLSIFPEEIVSKYNLKALAVDGWVYIEIRKGVYGLKQAGLLANQLLQKCLAPFGYYSAWHTPGLWLHKTRPIACSLIVDEFTVKYVEKHHANHLR